MWKTFKDKLKWFFAIFTVSAIIWFPITIIIFSVLHHDKLNKICEAKGGDLFNIGSSKYLCIKDGLIVKLGD